MSLYVYVEDQTVPYGQAALLNDSIPCNRRFVLHQNGSGILTTRGIVNNPCAMFTRYKIKFIANIAVPEGGTPGEISLAVAVNGERVPYSLSAVTPTVANAFFNVSGIAYVDVVRCGTPSVSIENTSATEEAITCRNLAVDVTRVA